MKKRFKRFWKALRFEARACWDSYVHPADTDTFTFHRGILRKLRSFSSAKDNREVIARALALYDEVLTIQGKGGKLIVRHEDGEEEEIYYS